MSDSDSLFVGEDPNSGAEDLSEGKVIHDAFLDRLESHQASVSIDFDLWMRQIIVIILNTMVQKEWPVDKLKNAIDTAARRYRSIPSYLKHTLIPLKATEGGADDAHLQDGDDEDDPNKYELVFTVRELKACAGLLTNVTFVGSRRKFTQDRLYSLFRHKVLGQDAINLNSALRRRRAEKETERVKQKEAEENAAANQAIRQTVEDVQQGLETATQGSKRRRGSSDEGDADSLYGLEILHDDEIRATLGDGWLDSSDESHAGDDQGSDMNQKSPPTKRPKIPICFRAQTRHDLQKMQPQISLPEQNKKLRTQVEKLQRENQRLKSRNREHKRARATAEIARTKAEEREARAKHDLAAGGLALSEKHAKLEKWKRALEQDRKSLESLNSKVTKDFW